MANHAFGYGCANKKTEFGLHVVFSQAKEKTFILNNLLVDLECLCLIIVSVFQLGRKENKKENLLIALVQGTVAEPVH